VFVADSLLARAKKFLVGDDSKTDSKATNQNEERLEIIRLFNELTTENKRKALKALRRVNEEPTDDTPH
jgi:hypothetical protein